MYRYIIILYIIISTSYFSQNNWYGGNLKKVNEVSMDVIVNGLDDPMWEEKVIQLSYLFIERYKLKINPEAFSPSMVISISVIESGKNIQMSYNIDLSVYDLFITKEDYTSNFTKQKIIKKFRTGIIYQQNILGQSSNESMREDMEDTLITLLDGFIDQWYQDNPIKQF